VGILPVLWGGVVTPPNPFVELAQDPVGVLTAAAYATLLLAALVGTWWALSRNLLYLLDNWQDGWIVLVPLGYAARTMAVLGLVAVDLALVAGIIGVLT
jgi:membrane protease YdiL (CAAX protease family)